MRALVGFFVFLACQSAWALGGFIGLSVGNGRDYSTENIVEAEDEAACLQLNYSGPARTLPLDRPRVIKFRKLPSGGASLGAQTRRWIGRCK